MRIAVVGGGPGGLYFSILMRKVRPDWAVCVFERNRPGDAFGFGVVFSDETLSVFEHADPESYWAITERFARWTDIDIHYRGSVTRSGGHGFAALGRRELLGILQERALELGRRDPVLRPRRRPLSELEWADRGRRRGRGVERDPARAGGRSSCRRSSRRFCRYMWLGTDLVFDAFKFFMVETPDGVFQAHAYPYDDRMSTFIVEMQRAGVARRRA